MNKETALIPTNEELNVYQVMAKTATQSKLFDKIGGEAGLLSIMLMARELGLPAFQAIMGGMNVIQGKVELSPRLMNSMIRKSGHRVEVQISTDQLCTLRGVRHDTKEEHIVSFSIDDARRAGLVRSGGGWEKYPSDMLFARCISRLARRLFADVISTAYVEGEIERPDLVEETAGDHSRVIEVAHEEKKPEPKAMTIDDFILELKKTDGSFDGHSVEEYLYEVSTHTKNGKVVPIEKTMLQALKMPQRFISSYLTWYMNKSGETAPDQVAIDKV